MFSETVNPQVSKLLIQFLQSTGNLQQQKIVVLFSVKTGVGRNMIKEGFRKAFKLPGLFYVANVEDAAFGEIVITMAASWEISLLQ
ncbi:hypothetical protein HUJ04_012613 [Dendroctonus ponderosae]|nr:hypothetical protein HUJ04_012613 [Dendroctonus ponderosae]KAH1029845.1 hypothetical protein HUJ05_003004 [Dendroctonus ponderosae]